MNAYPALAIALKSATQPLHHQLDHHPILRGMLASPPALADYRRALAALYGPVNYLENSLAGYLPNADFPARSAVLAEDLSQLHQTPFEHHSIVPRLESPADKVGALYVLEGAQLGGTVIARHLHQHLPTSVPVRFFAEAEGLPRWQRFWAYLSPQLDELPTDVVVASAKATFAFFLAHFDQCLNAQ